MRLTLNQYQAGTVAYTSVVVAQTTALSDEQSALTIIEDRLVASAALVEGRRLEREICRPRRGSLNRLGRRAPGAVAVMSVPPLASVTTPGPRRRPW